MSGALSHIRVLDLTRVLAGPWAAQVLADLGAEVIKIERPGSGDDTRAWGPPFVKDRDGNDTSDAAYFMCANRGKQSLTLDIAKPEGQQIIRELAQIAQLDAREFAQLAGIRSRWDGGPGGRFHVPAAGRKTEMLDLELRLARDLIAAPAAFSALSDEDRVLLTESEALLGELARWLVGRLGQPGLPHLAEISAVLGESDYAPDLERLLRQIMGSDSPTGAPLLTDETLATLSSCKNFG